MNERTMKNDLSCNDKNDPWSNHPKTQFGPIYPFFRNMNPSLHYIPKVHFDRIWILKLKRFLLENFSAKIILINLSPVRDEF